MRRVKKRTESECCGHRPDVLRIGAAAATDPVAAGLTPFPGKFAESGGVGAAGPAAGFGNPGLAGVGVDGDALFRDGVDFPDDRQDVARRGAVDADSDDVRSGIEETRAIFNRLAVAGVGLVGKGVRASRMASASASEGTVSKARKSAAVSRMASMRSA
jgi:hypothetical protein